LQPNISLEASDSFANPFSATPNTLTWLSFAPTEIVSPDHKAAVRNLDIQEELVVALEVLCNWEY